MRTVSAGIITLILIAIGVSPMFAQSDAARLQGIITDQTSALVPGAKVQVTDTSTNRILETMSAPDNGAWSFPILPPGDYVLEVSSADSSPSSRMSHCRWLRWRTSTSSSNRARSRNRSSSPKTRPWSTARQFRHRHDRRHKTDQYLPLNGRNFTQLATLIPGVNRGVPNNVATGQGNNAETFRYGTSNGASLVVNGARPQANNFTLDGLDNNESLVNTIVFFPSAEAIQKIKVQTNIAPAELAVPAAQSSTRR